MSTTLHSRHALVFGASGLVGRHVVLALSAAGVRVTAAVRSAASADRLMQWLADHGLREHVGTVLVDFSSTSVVHDEAAARSRVTEIYNCAGVYRFGMTASEARDANVGIVERIVDFAAGLPALTRLVHVSGYRVGGQDPASVPWPEHYRADLYQRLGAYEASKMESDAVLQARALQHNVPFTVVNPSSVIGDSVTGETDQLIGLATTFQQIWNGRVAALPGNASTFLPVVTVDYLAEFMIAAAVDPLAANESYWVLDDRTPPLFALLRDLAIHVGVTPPRLRIPVGVITRLPRWITGADPETLSFLSSDTYPTRTANELAQRHGLRQPDVTESLRRWADYLVAHRFDLPGRSARRFISPGGTRTFTAGLPDASRLILPGLPLNAETWEPITASLDARVVDLPGMGLSNGAPVRDWDAWTSGLIEDHPVDLIGHSLGAAAAVIAAHRHPASVRSLTLVAPFFLQHSRRFSPVHRRLLRAFLRHARPTWLARALTGNQALSEPLASSASDLRRHGARSASEYLAAASSSAWRRELRAMLNSYGGPIHIIYGELDPLASDLTPSLDARSISSIPGAGHYPNLTHPAELRALLERWHSPYESAKISTGSSDPA